MNKNVGKAPPGVEGVITRGKTAKNRLRRVDIFLLLYAHELLTRKTKPDHPAYVIDLGYGDEAITVIEMADRLRQVNPHLPILGVEIDPQRVENGLLFTNDYTHFRLGGFNLPLIQGESARIIRAFNVLRQYKEEEVLPAWQTMAQSLLSDGLIIEGTSDPFGKIWTANILRKKESGLTYEGLLFSTNFHWGFNPEIFQPVLPKNFIHRMLPGERIYQFLQDWRLSCQENIAFKHWGLHQWFSQSAHGLHRKGYSLLLTRRYLAKGFLFWRWNEKSCE